MRKQIIFSILLVLGLMSAMAQSSYTLTINVHDNHGKALNGIKVWLQEKQSGEVITKKTNASGDVSFDVPPGEWSVNLTGMLNYEEVSVGEGSSGRASFGLTYNVEEIKKHQAIIDGRKNISLQEEMQTNPNPKLIEGYARVDVQVRNTDNKYLPDVDVALVSLKQKKIFKAKTNRSGTAVFLVPIDDFYSIDAGEAKDLTNTGDIVRVGIYTLKVRYEPTVITEEIKNDTVRQKITHATKSSSSRTMYDLTIKRSDGSPAANEYVYLDQIHGQYVFMGETDNNGMVSFLLPNDYKYMIHFEFRRDLDVISLMHSRGIGNGQAEFTYMPDPMLEHPEEFIPEPDEYFMISFENFIEKQLPDPTEDLVEVYAEWGSGTVNANSKEAVLQVAFAVGSNVAGHERPPVNLAFVIDRSGSMAGYDRIEALKESIDKFSKKLSREDMVSLITFESEPTMDMRLKKFGNGSTFREKIALIEPGGGTNIYKGLVMGFDELQANYSSERSNVLILLTDGYGSEEPKKVVEMSREYTSEGIDLVTVGVGDYYNSALLSLLSEECGAQMHHAGESKDIYELFEKQLLAVISPVAYDATLEVYYNDMVKLQSLYGYPIASNNNSVAKVEIGDLYAGYQKFTLLHFKLDHPTAKIEKEPITMVLSYTLPDNGKRIEVKQEAYLKWEEETGKYQLIVENHMKRLYAVAILNQSIKVMLEGYALGDYDLVHQTHERAIEQLKELFPDAMDKELSEIVAQMNQYANAIYQAEKNEKH
ncbi:MAG: hypothetical protein C0592_00920 [Marinilabiliales bacterium]|nr:MAG: hypothetical protein C0592_00920 [Marinilabiliales bacterium]